MEDTTSKRAPFSISAYSLSASERFNPAEKIRQQIINKLSANAEAILVRDPVVDTRCPLTSDIDLLVFRKAEGLLPERLSLPEFPDAPMIDVIWLSINALSDPESFAQCGLLPHRLLSSEIFYDKEGFVTNKLEVVQKKMFQSDIHSRRIAGFFKLAGDTVREIGITWDFPPMAMFWLHMAYTACLAAMHDGLRSYCPNIYTRPFDYLPSIEEKTRVEIKNSFIRDLHLDYDPYCLIAPLKNIHMTVSSRFPEPQWPENMREDTRYEYRYFISEEELNWRISVAEEMTARGNPYAAVYYLRFWAYALSRIPMVYHRANEGIDVSFLRPERAILPDLKKNCPEILDDLTAILSGRNRLTVKDVTHGIDMLSTLRAKALDFLASQGVELTELPEWKPFQLRL